MPQTPVCQSFSNSNLSGGSAAGQCVLSAQVIVTSLTRSVRYCIKKVLRYNNVSLPSTIRMRIVLHNLCTLCGEARLRFKLEYELE